MAFLSVRGNATHMVIQYKCPNCGSDMAFDSESGALACDSCGNKETIQSIPSQYVVENDNAENTSSYNNSGQEQFFQEGEVQEYHCNNCGAEIITDSETTATTCSFCGAGTVLGDRLTGALAPVKVIPFTISKEQAQTAFKAWCRKGLLTPKGFMTADRIKSIAGMYVPFWLYDLDSDGEVNATCTKVRTYTRGDYIYTETSYFDVYRKVDLSFLKIPTDASTKMNDKLMDKLEPYHYDNLKDFSTPYLAGYIAEKYNQTDSELFPRVKERAERYVDTYIRSTIQGYSTTSYTNKRVNIRSTKADYTLLPVWMVCYDYNQSEHIFAMNGQTGKIVGTPPLSASRMIKWFSGISASVFIIIRLIMFILGGGF